MQTEGLQFCDVGGFKTNAFDRNAHAHLLPPNSQMFRDSQLYQFGHLGVTGCHVSRFLGDTNYLDHFDVISVVRVIRINIAELLSECKSHTVDHWRDGVVVAEPVADSYSRVSDLLNGSFLLLRPRRYERFGTTSILLLSTHMVVSRWAGRLACSHCSIF